jgi:hypothetical protein
VLIDTCFWPCANTFQAGVDGAIPSCSTTFLFQRDAFTGVSQDFTGLACGGSTPPDVSRLNPLRVDYFVAAPGQIRHFDQRL